MGKNSVQIIEAPKPKVMEDCDVVVKAIGSTVCGSYLHLLHGTIVEPQKADILGHEFCGIVESAGPAVSRLNKGDRVVASFQIACSQGYYCKEKLSSQCEKTNSNTLANVMYGERTAGMFGYSHFTSGFAGGQAEYVRAPYGDISLLKLPDVLATSWNCVLNTGVEKGDVVAVWSAGPVGQMAADFAFYNGASRLLSSMQTGGRTTSNRRSQRWRR